MDELVEFLLARIAIEEGHARAALGLLGMETEWHRVEWLRARGLTIADAHHMTHHSPRRVLAECEAKRLIVEWSGERERIWVGKISDDPERPRPDQFLPGPLRRPADAVVLRFLALPYADHPEYREEWRP